MANGDLLTVLGELKIGTWLKQVRATCRMTWRRIRRCMTRKSLIS
jgi:hypothetical protein